MWDFCLEHEHDNTIFKRARASLSDLNPYTTHHPPQKLKNHELKFFVMGGV